MKQTTKATIAITAALIALASIQLPSLAVTSDPAIVQRLQSARNVLIGKQNDLLRDQDDLNRQLQDLRRIEDKPSYAINDVCQKLDQKTDLLQRTRWELKQVEQALL